jgi:hypothetical protein
MNSNAQKLGEQLASEITMRDYIAVEAMKAYLSRGTPITTAKSWAYDAAEKMLEESVKQNENC